MIARRKDTVKWIAYCRVSTGRQGRSGLGLEAQRQAILGYIARSSGELVSEFVEVESGKLDDRPKLREALEACQRVGARLIIAKLDRLSRDVAFIANLMRSSADFVVCDLPEANRLTIHIMAAVAESEREMIAKRTRDALQAAKARGVKLGTPENLSEKAKRKGRKLGEKARVERSNQFALSRYPEVQKLLDGGMSLNAIARKWNEEGILSVRGRAGSWTARSVSNLIERGKSLKRA